MNIKSKRYALAMCTTLLCAGNAWGLECLNIAQDYQSYAFSNPGTILDNWKVTENGAVNTAGKDWTLVSGPDSTNTCIYKTNTTAGEAILKLQRQE